MASCLDSSKNGSSFLDVTDEGMYNESVSGASCATIYGSQPPESVRTTFVTDLEINEETQIDELCSKCMKSCQQEAATHFCRNCEKFGNYLCSKCLQHHNKWLPEHKKIFTLSEWESENIIRGGMQMINGATKSKGIETWLQNHQTTDTKTVESPNNTTTYGASDSPYYDSPSSVHTYDELPEIPPMSRHQSSSNSRFVELPVLPPRSQLKKSSSSRNDELPELPPRSQLQSSSNSSWLKDRLTTVARYVEPPNSRTTDDKSDSPFYDVPYPSWQKDHPTTVAKFVESPYNRTTDDQSVSSYYDFPSSRCSDFSLQTPTEDYSSCQSYFEPQQIVSTVDDSRLEHDYRDVHSYVNDRLDTPESQNDEEILYDEIPEQERSRLQTSRKSRLRESDYESDKQASREKKTNGVCSVM